MSYPAGWRRRARPFLIALAALLALPSLALADAELVAASPGSGEILTESPPAVTLRFDEEIDPDRSSVEVRRGSTIVARGGVDPDAPDTLVAALPVLVPATYEVRWTVASGDGHLLRGQYTFQVVAPPPTPTPSPSSTPSPTPTPTPALSPSPTPAPPGPHASSAPTAPTPAPTLVPTPLVTAPPTASPTAGATPAPTDPQPATSAADVVIPLAALAALVAGFAAYFLRRRRV